MGRRWDAEAGIVGRPASSLTMFVHLPTRSRPTVRWATPLLFALLWGAYLWASTRSGAIQRTLLLDWGALTGGQALGDTLRALWVEGRGLRLLTALFLHADWTHLLGNLIFLLIFGLPAERVMGPWRFLLLFLLGGAVANLAAVLVIGAPHRLVIGASGAVSAVIGAYLALFPRARLGVVVPLGLFLEFVRAPASLLIGVWAVLQIVFAYIGPAFGAVAWAAHIAGFGFGVLFALLVRTAIARRLRDLRGY
jgi:membrane associated rhomboid family serine protease